MLNGIFHYLRNTGKFSKRIHNRHDLFWKGDQGEIVRNTPMSKFDTIEQWKSGPYWQRKLSNKNNAREFAQMQGCRVPDLYWKGAQIESVDFNNLPPCFVIRPTTGHSGGNVFIMLNGINLFDKKAYTPRQIQNVLKNEVQRNNKIEFLIEEFLTNEDGKYAILTDYKFFCFKGHIACVYVIDRSGPRSGNANFYDENWMRLKRIHLDYPPTAPQIQPACFKEMVDTAKRLSVMYDIFVRVDLYATTKGCVFGEFTPTPSLGNNYTGYGKKLLATYWDKYCNGLI